MSLTKKRGSDKRDFTAQWWDEMAIPDIDSSWIYIEMLTFYSGSGNRYGFTEVEVYQGKSK